MQKRKTGEIQSLCSGTIKHKQPLGKTPKDKSYLSFRLQYDYIKHTEEAKYSHQSITCIVYGWRADYANHLENNDCVLITGKLKYWRSGQKDALRKEPYYIEVMTIMPQPRSFEPPQKVRKASAVRHQGYIVETDGASIDETRLQPRNVKNDMDILKNVEDDGDYPF